MAGRVSQEAKDALARVLAGETVRRVSIETGVSRSTLYRHLKALGRLKDGVRVGATIITNT